MDEEEIRTVMNARVARSQENVIINMTRFIFKIFGLIVALSALAGHATAISAQSTGGDNNSTTGSFTGSSLSSSSSSLGTSTYSISSTGASLSSSSLLETSASSNTGDFSTISVSSSSSSTASHNDTIASSDEATTTLLNAIYTRVNDEWRIRSGASALFLSLFLIMSVVACCSTMWCVHFYRYSKYSQLKTSIA